MAYIYTGCSEIDTLPTAEGWVSVRIRDRDAKQEIEVNLTPAEAGQFAQALLDDAATIHDRATEGQGEPAK